MSKTKMRASVLSFNRCLNPSDALMASTSWGSRQTTTPLTVDRKTIRGTISNKQKPAVAKDAAKLNAEVIKPNLQEVDYVSLPVGDDTLEVSFYLRVLGNVGNPNACNNPLVRERLKEMRASYKGMGRLAKRYAANIANARWLWRNAVGAENIEVIVEEILDGKATQEWTFDALEISLTNLTDLDSDIETLGQSLQEALEDPKGHKLYRVRAFSRLGPQSEIYPSQTMTPGRVYFQVHTQAAMTTQKIGNAIRTIDTWFEQADEIGPIPVEAYGSVTSQGVAYRQKDHFYKLFEQWLDGKEVGMSAKHFVMAMLIRGGVFGGKD